MRHQPVVLADIPAEIGEIVRIAVRAMEAEGEDRQADVARISHAVNDLRAGQHQADEAEITEIAGQLVDDARLARGERVQFGEITLWPLRLARLLQRCDPADAGGFVRAPPSAWKARGQRGSLAGAVSLRMRGENLLAQGGAGARHADDEHRRGIGIARPRPMREAIRVEHRDIGIDECAMFVTRERLAALEQRVARLPMRERARLCILRPTRTWRDRNAP